MATRSHLSPTRGYGPLALAAARFAPAATQAGIVVSEQWGVRSITRDSTGIYTIALLGKPRGVVAIAVPQGTEATAYHFVKVDSQNDTAGTITISHRSIAFASVASGPALSDTVDAISVVVYERSE